MVEPFNKYQDKRVFFPTGEQQKFLLKVSKITGLSWYLLVLRLGISKRTLFDWRREKYSLSLSSLKKMCQFTNLNFPTNIDIKEPFWSTKNTARAGGLARYRKYGTIGNPLIRRQKWLKWWEKTGKYNLNKYFVARQIIRPKKSTRLAEFVGILMGDGGITERQIVITLNSVVDKEYIPFVEKLIIGLFKLRPKIHPRKGEQSTKVAVSRTSLVTFCQSLGLKIGNKIKQNLDIPYWIKRNKGYTNACIRGLMDTDGCLFMERHKINSKIYSYPRLSLVSASPFLRSSVYKALEEQGFSPFIRGERSVQLENYFDIKRYFAKIGTNHPKNEEKFQKLSGGFG